MHPASPPGPGPGAAGVAPPPPHPSAESAYLSEIAELKSLLVSREQHLQYLESQSQSSLAVLQEWQDKYARLQESHRKLQKNNHCLEDKLLRVVDKFDSDKNMINRDMAGQSQKLVQAKLTIQQLRDQNRELQSDLQLSIGLLQQRPGTFVAQRLDHLPVEMQQRVRTYVQDRQAQERKAHEGKRITVDVEAIGGGAAGEEKVSAAILAKVLEERAKERKKEHKFCIDVGTQTHGWIFPDKIGHQAAMSSSAAANPAQLQPASSPPSVSESGGGVHQSNGAEGNGKAPSQQMKPTPSLAGVIPTPAAASAAAAAALAAASDSSSATAEVIQILRSISMDDQRGRERLPKQPGPQMQQRVAHEHRQKDAALVNNILWASVIRSPPASMTSATSSASGAGNGNVVSADKSPSFSSLDTLGTSESESLQGLVEDDPAASANAANASTVAALAASPMASAENTSRAAAAAATVGGNGFTRRNRPANIMTRSVTYSLLQTDI